MDEFFFKSVPSRSMGEGSHKKKTTQTTLGIIQKELQTRYPTSIQATPPRGCNAGVLAPPWEAP